MASFSNSALLKTPTMLEQLLEEINFQRTKEMRQLLKDDSGFVMLQGTTYWTDLFVRHFLFQNENTIDCDDLLFFVRKKHVKSSSRYLPKFETEVDVFRKDSRKLPIGDPDIDWEETVYLNLIIHQFDYTLTLAICTRTSPKELQVLRRHSQKVYASPSRRRMDTKGEVEEMTYPHICFMVDNFDEVFCDILVRDGEMVCVELVASDREGAIQGVIFLGSIRYDALKKVYDARQSSLSTKMAQRMTFGLFSSGAAQRCEFVRMKGPQGKGHAEMAVTKPKGSGVETPTSEPGYCMTDMWDSDWDSDPEEFYQSRHQRRSSDPSANLNNFVRGGWKAKAGTDGIGARARSENEGLDLIDVGVTEIEAGDVRDELMLGRQYTECNHRNDNVDDEPASSSQKSISCVNCMDTTGCCWRNRMSQHDTLSIMSDIYSRPPPSASLKKSRNNSTISSPGAPGAAQLTLKTLLAHIELGDDATIKCDELNSSPKKQITNNGPFNRDDFEFADDAISLNDETDCDQSQNVCHQTHIIKKESVINVNGKEELPQPCCNKLLSNVIEENEEIDDNNKKIIKNYNSREFIKKTEIKENNIIEIKIETTSAKYSKNVSSVPSTTQPTNNKTTTMNTEEDLNGNDGSKFLQKLRRFSTLPKSQKLLNQQQRKWLLHNKQSLIVPPHRVTPDGTDIYYWCDIPKKSANELDDGQYNPLWTMRGFTQSFHFWKENKRAQSVPLNAFLTYVTLPWWSIAKDILDHREGPILTF